MTPSDQIELGGAVEHRAQVPGLVNQRLREAYVMSYALSKGAQQLAHSYGRRDQ